MSKKIDLATAGAGVYKMMLGLEAYVHQSGLEAGLVNLIKLSASYINGCAYCVDMHTKEARAAGETEQRLFAVPVWPETPFFTPRERAALAWTEAVTRISREGVPSDVYDEAVAHFNDKELADLTLAVIAINGWNRLAISFHADVGSYKVPTKL
ncbi:MAG TPA: carboxymuconolactone decarboxylase family protein [Gemmatimonadaceae bacterium]|jgi:AhpD family alkylhydroperoxidase